MIKYKLLNLFKKQPRWIKIQIIKILEKLFYYNNRLIKPKDFILTGIPRSGTSLLSTILCQPSNCYCFNEIFYRIEMLPIIFYYMKKRIKANQPIPNKAKKNGELISNTRKFNEGKISENVITKKTNKKIILGSKVTIPYLNKINLLKKLNYKIIILIRNPVYTLASWNTSRDKLSPVNRVLKNDIHSHWSDIEFNTNSKLSRQAEIWEYYSKLINNIKEKFLVLKYENLTKETSKTLKRIQNYIGFEKPENISNLIPERLEPIKCFNNRSRYENVDEIIQIVKKYCPSARAFGYKLKNID